MAKRDYIRRFVEKKTVEFFALFNAEINTVKKLFDAVKRSQPKSPILPRYAGLAKYAMNLMRRLEQSHKVVDSVRYTLPQVRGVACVIGLASAWGCGLVGCGAAGRRRLSG